MRGRLRLKEELPRRAEPPRFRPARAGRLRSGRLPLFDCPGQIGLYTHLPVLRPLADGVLRKFTTPCAASTSIDSQFIADASRVPSASQVSLSAIMMSLELPRINVLPKVDILQKCERKKVDRFPGFPNGRRRGLISHSQAGHYQELPGSSTSTGEIRPSTSPTTPRVVAVASGCDRARGCWSDAGLAVGGNVAA